VPLVGQVSRYIISAGGKRLRPALLLLVCGALGYRASSASTWPPSWSSSTRPPCCMTTWSTNPRCAAAAPPPTRTFGNPASVLVGDFLYSRAFQMMLDANDMRIMQILAEATNVIAEGEVLQLMNMHDASLDEAGYLRVIRSKTAKLFEASARLARCWPAPPVEEACADYGQALGTAFQVIDDVLDYDGDAHEMGKNLGDDLREGKVTLPLIAAMQRGTPAQRALIRHAIETGAVGRTRHHRIVRETGALDAHASAAAAEAQRAIECIACCRQFALRGLVQLAAHCLQRRN
jgi:octaprenyl-diphosphate synthase